MFRRAHRFIDDYSLDVADIVGNWAALTRWGRVSAPMRRRPGWREGRPLMYLSAEKPAVRAGQSAGDRAEESALDRGIDHSDGRSNPSDRRPVSAKAGPCRQNSVVRVLGRAAFARRTGLFT